MSIFSSLTKAVIGVVVETPIALIADAVTLGGALNNQREPYTATALKKVMDNVTDATEGKP